MHAPPSALSGGSGQLNRLTRGNPGRRGAKAAAIEYVRLTDILGRVPEDRRRSWLLFDGVTDVRNFGAIARSAECAGAHGLITPLKNSAPVNAEAIRSSAGAATTVCRVARSPATLKALQAEGFPGRGRHGEEPQHNYYDADFRRCTVIVMSRGYGHLEKVLKLCDEAAGHSADRPHRVAQASRPRRP